MTSRRLLTALTLGGFGWVPVVAAQPVVPPQADISRLRVEPPRLPGPTYDFRIQNAEKAGIPLAVDEVRFQVTRIEIEGAKTLPADTVRAIFAPLEGKTILLQDLRAAGQALEDRYHKAGYFLTRVFIPPQAIADGVLRVRVVEGFIAGAQIAAPNRASEKLVRKILDGALRDRPAAFGPLDSRLLLLNDLPGTSASSVLSRSAVPGASDMDVNVTPKAPSFYAHVDNGGSEVLGPLNYAVGGSFGQPFGRPGSLDLGYATAGEHFAELRSGTARYAFPLGSNGITGSVGGLVAFASPGGPVAELKVRSRIISIDVRLRKALKRSRNNSVYLDAALTLNRSRTKILGEVTSDDRSTVGELTLSWQRSDLLAGDLTASVGLLHGFRIFGANTSAAKLPSVAGFDPGFARLVYKLQRNQRMTSRLSASASLQGQFTRDRLASGEQISFGGQQIGRGYDPSLVSGERGISVSGEVLLALPQLSRPGFIDDLQVYAFGDWSRATSIAFADDPERSVTISSLGFGARFTALRKAMVDVQLADPRKILPNVPSGPRFRFSLTVLF
jgi:hemolysin activation/secretion protein